MASKKCLNFEFDYFVDISKQLAYKRFQHKKFWNVVLHAGTSVFRVWCTFYITSFFIPSLLLHFNLLTIIALCLLQDVHLGLGAVLVYPVLYYHAMYISTLSFLQACSLSVLVYIIENNVGQNWIECADFATLNTIKSVETSFLVVDVYNDLFLALYHNTATLMIRLDLRMDLMDSSNETLRKILDRMKKVP